MVDSRPCSTCKRILPTEQLMPRQTGRFCGVCDDDHPFNPDPVRPLCTDCDEPEAFHRG